MNIDYIKDMGYKINTVTGPRVKLKSASVILKKDITEFKKIYPQHKHITFHEFNAIIKQFNLNIIDKVIEDPNGVSLPQRIGTFFIASFDTARNKNMDFGRSNKIGEKVYYSNWDTDNRYCKIMFHRSFSLNFIKNHRFWMHSPARTFREKVSKAFKKDWPKYFYVNDQEGLRLRDILKQE